MRVLVVANLWPSQLRPETGSFVRDQVDELRRLGVTVDVVSASATSSRKTRLRYVRLVTASLRASRRSCYDVVACHIAFPTGVVGMLCRRMGRARLVLHAHGSDVMALPYRSAAHFRAARMTFRSADHIVANSLFIRNALVEQFDVSASRVSVVSPGVAPGFFAGPGRVRRTGILYVGRLVAEKGLGTLIEAIGEVSRSSAQELTVVGHGPARQSFESLAQDLGVVVRWRGSIPRDEVAALMRGAAIVAVPSTMPEGLGLTAVEGLASGAIVVSTTSGALGESVIEGRTGFTAQSGDVASLSQALCRALAAAERPETRQVLRREGLLVADQHQADRAARRLVKAYERTMQQHGSR